MSKKLIVLLVFVALIGLLVAGCTVYEEIVFEVPPDPRYEERSQKPGSVYIWISGHWGWKSKLHKYKWISGHWAKKQSGKRWVSGHWKKHRGGWIWVPGHWK